MGRPWDHSRTPVRDLKYGVGLNHMPSGRFAANGAWLAVQVMAHNLARWTGWIRQTLTSPNRRRTPPSQRLGPAAALPA